MYTAPVTVRSSAAGAVQYTPEVPPLLQTGTHATFIVNISDQPEHKLAFC